MRLIGVLMVRNEAAPDRYLRRVLENMQTCCDGILVLDDDSSDETPSLCAPFAEYMFYRRGTPHAWGSEAPARAELWRMAVASCEPDDWLCFWDADMLLSRDPRPLMATTALNTWYWPLYDLWDSEATYRADGHWQAHKAPRAWMVQPHRVMEGWTPTWNHRGLHCGHLPENWASWGAVAPSDYFWRHLSYVKPDHRAHKYRQYLGQRDQLTAGERAHAESIADGLDPRQLSEVRPVGREAVARPALHALPGENA